MKRYAIPPYEQELILAHILKKSREYVLTHPEKRLNKTQIAKFEKLVKRRERHEPLAYIFGHKEFYGLDFMVDKNTLIPRPETELLVEEIIKLTPENSAIVDVGTGSGNIVIALAKSIKKKNIFFGFDISNNALQVAKYNARKNKVDKKIKFLKGDLLEPVIKNCSMLSFPCSMILVANLPYLSEKIYRSTAPDIRNFEPKTALLSGIDGLDHYGKLFSQTKYLVGRRFSTDVQCFLEISPEQKKKMEKLARKYFPKSKISFLRDLAGKWRVAIIDL